MRRFCEEQQLPTTSARELALTVFIRGCRSTSRMDVGSIPTLLHNMEMAGKWPTNASTTLFWDVNKEMKGWGCGRETRALALCRWWCQKFLMMMFSGIPERHVTISLKSDASCIHIFLSFIGEREHVSKVLKKSATLKRAMTEKTYRMVKKGLEFQTNSQRRSSPVEGVV